MKTFLISSIFILNSFYSIAQIPSGYYNDADGKTGYTLKTSLYDIIKGHNAKSYGDLWDLYKTSDDKPNGKVWDMYSDVPGGTPAYEYTFVSNQCGNYSGEGSCYNREHSFPKSWFNDANPMITDPFHIVPSDGYVNGKRSNYAYGEVGSASWTSTNGSKLGTSNYPGYSGTVFEPIDEYKGDFARGYFYMATRYENLIAGWEKNNANGDGMLNGTSDQVYEDWALEMLIAWHNADPVSQKEIDRNNDIFDYQGNRNPFIDHPEYVAAVWGGTPSSSITVTASITNFGDVDFGEVSNTQSYTVSGANLSDDIIISASTGFEVSLTDIDQDFTSSITLTNASGVVASTTVYIRFKPASDTNSVVNGTITHTTSGSGTKTIDVAGAERDADAPSLSITASLVDFGSVNFGQVSSNQSYTISAANLTNNLLISASDGFQISLTEVSQEFASSLSIAHTGGNVPNTIIYVRFNPIGDSNTAISGTLLHSSTGANPQELTVNGTEYFKVVPEINFSFSLRNIDPTENYEIQLFSDKAPNDNITMTMEPTEGSSLNYTQDYTTMPELVNNVLAFEWPAGELSTTVLVTFKEVDGSYPSGKLIFDLKEGNDYLIGTNNKFELNVRGDDVINAIDAQQEHNITIYPNPASDEIHLVWNNNNFNYKILNQLGQVVLSGRANKAVDVDISTLKPGQYTVQYNSKSTLITKKILVY